MAGDKGIKSQIMVSVVQGRERQVWIGRPRSTLGSGSDCFRWRGTVRITGRH